MKQKRLCVTGHTPLDVRFMNNNQGSHVQLGWTTAFVIKVPGKVRRRRVVEQVKHMWSINVPTWLESHPFGEKKKWNVIQASKVASCVKSRSYSFIQLPHFPEALDGKRNKPETDQWALVLRSHAENPNRCQTGWWTWITELLRCAPPFYTATLLPNQLCGLAHNTRPLSNIYTALSKGITLSGRFPKHTPSSFLPKQKKPFVNRRIWSTQGK